MINDLLDFTLTRLHGSLKIAPAAIDIGIVARGIVDETKGLHPECEVQLFTTGNLQGNWDEARIGQLMANLLLNAVEYGAGSAPITITVQSESDNEVRLLVRNEGVPISAELLPGIFEPMTSAHHEGEAKQGTPAHLGLGLYIAREIVAAHGGSIGVTSIPEGTTFEQTARKRRAPDVRVELVPARAVLADTPTRYKT